MVRRMRRRVIIRVLVWTVLLLGALAWRLWADVRERQDQSTHEIQIYQEVPHRAAEQELWRRDIAALGAQRLGKRLVWRPLQQVGERRARPQGELIWWHDGRGERLAYLAAPGEDPTTAAPQLGIDLHQGSAVLYNMHGDSSLQERLFELPMDYQLPEDWTVLTPPQGGQQAAADESEAESTR